MELYPLDLVTNNARSKFVTFLFVLLCGVSLSAVQETGDKPYIFFFSGPSGSGRAKLILKVHSSFSIPHISSADLVMDHIHDDSELGEMARVLSAKGGSFSNDFFFEALFERVGRGGCQDGFVLDGVPRTVEQAESLYSKLSQTFNLLAFTIDIPDSMLIERVEDRFYCPECGQVYQQKGLKECRGCETILLRRDEDNPAVLSEKLKAFHSEMDPVLKYYTSKQMLVTLRGDKPVDEIVEDAFRIIEAKTKLKRPGPSCELARTFWDW